MELSQDLYNRCRDAFLECSEFDSDALLKSVFMTPELRPFQDGLPSATKKDERVDMFLSHIIPKSHRKGHPVLLLFLEALSEKYHESDALRVTLDELRNEVEAEIKILDDGNAVFYLNFRNREAELDFIKKCLETNDFVQICSLSGLGKTFLLRQLQEDLSHNGWRTARIDFGSSDNIDLRADRHLFLQDTSKQLLADSAPDIFFDDDYTALDKVGVQLAHLEKATLLLDNVDRAAPDLLEWFRGTLLVKLTAYLPLRVVASGQKMVYEWTGHRPGRPFKEVNLSAFDDPLLISDIIEDVVDRYGPTQVKQKRNQQQNVWETNKREMVEGVYQLTRGHPLAIERVLHYALKKNGFVHSDFFSNHHSELCERCLAPIVGAHILPTIERDVREGFRSLCVFRYVWHGLIQSLIVPKVPEDVSTFWLPFSDSERPFTEWWSGLVGKTEYEGTHLIAFCEDRDLFAISPVVRQIIALVLQTQDADGFRSQNTRAYYEFEKLFQSPNTPLQTRAACIPELIFHSIQANSILPADAIGKFSNLIHNFLRQIDNTEDLFNTTERLTIWFRQDAELIETVNLFVGGNVFNQLTKVIKQFRNGEPEVHDE